MDEVYEHYTEEAKKHGTEPTSTMADLSTRELEIQTLKKCFEEIGVFESRGLKILEIGCGNGYTAEKLAAVLPSDPHTTFECIDYNEAMIELAKKRHLENVSYSFHIGNALQLTNDDESVDVVFTERCLINLLKWEEQKVALGEIQRVLRKDGYYIMLEAFTDGLFELNEARREVGLEPNPMPFHNRFFDKNETFRFMDNGFELVHTSNSNFLSTYYYGSRVLYPALIKPSEPQYNTAFVKFWAELSSMQIMQCGNYSSIQCYIFRKK